MMYLNTICSHVGLSKRGHFSNLSRTTRSIFYRYFNGGSLLLFDRNLGERISTVYRAACFILAMRLMAVLREPTESE